MQYYEIVVEKRVDPRRADWFSGLELSYLPDDRTVLAGPLPDQTALYGIISRLRDLGLTLVSVVRVEQNQARPAGSGGNHDKG